MFEPKLKKKEAKPDKQAASFLFFIPDLIFWKECNDFQGKTGQKE
jgi:hypothetical protein